MTRQHQAQLKMERETAEEPGRGSPLQLTSAAARESSDAYMLARMAGASHEECDRVAAAVAAKAQEREERLGRGICQDCFSGYVQINGRFARCARCHGTGRARPRRLEEVL
jgi:hypothetical protein